MLNIINNTAFFIKAGFFHHRKKPCIIPLAKPKSTVLYIIYIIYIIGCNLAAHTMKKGFASLVPYYVQTGFMRAALA